MPANVRWIASASASAFHAARAIASGATLVDPTLHDALLQPAARLADIVSAAGLPAAMWSHLIPLSAGIYVHRELAKVALTKTVGRNRATDELLSKLAGAFGELQRAFDAAVPDAIDQIELRSAPLRELWDARGGGLLAGIGRLTEPELIVQQADVLLLKPALGGAGSAHLPYNSVSIEAVLTNPQAALPETLRLAWLLAQLHHDLPMHQGNLSRERLAEVGALAMLPPVLQAGEDVELCHYSQETLAASIEAWHIPAGADAAPVLEQWWSVYTESRPAWSVALAALDRMLREGLPA